MNFNNVLSTKEYFQNLNEAKDFRPAIWERNEKHLKKLEQVLFDEFTVEESISIINNFLDKSVYNLENIDIMIELNNSEFENVIESKIIPMFENDDIIYHVRNTTRNKMFTLKDGYFKEQDFEIKRKENI